MAALVWESILLNHAFCRGCDFISYSPGTHGMRQKGLKINVRHKKLKKKKRKWFLCFSSWTSLLKARSIMGGERQVGGEGVTPSHSWWWTMRPGWAGSRLPCWGAGDSALCTESVEVLAPVFLRMFVFVLFFYLSSLFPSWAIQVTQTIGFLKSVLPLDAHVSPSSQRTHFSIFKMLQVELAS